jgi:uncharacterized damage-inducible protein DinB/predicted RNase H-like HicB family nuclease
MNIIRRKPTYRLYVEVGKNGAMAHVAELPGCFSVGSDAARAVGNASREIRDFLLWLRSHREPLVPEAHVSRPTMADLYVAEVRQSGAPLQGGSYAALFPHDEEAWSDEKLERTLRWLSYSRADLLAAIEGLSEEEMHSRAIDTQRSLHRTLMHVANAEYGYTDRFAGPLEGRTAVTETEPSKVRERLAAVRDLLVTSARGVPQEERGKTIFAEWAWRPDEPWSLAKSLRRALEHEREHLREIQRL